MQSQNRFFDDLAKLATGAAGTLAGVGREMESSMRQAFERMVGGLDLVSRDEFEAAKAMAVAAREESAALQLRVEALEAAIANLAPKPAAPRAPRRKAGEDDGLPGLDG